MQGFVPVLDLFGKEIAVVGADFYAHNDVRSRETAISTGVVFERIGVCHWGDGVNGTEDISTIEGHLRH